jgi:hypothetical protein
VFSEPVSQQSGLPLPLQTGAEPSVRYHPNMQRSRIMEYNKDRVDEYTLALMLLVTHDRVQGCGARAWKGFDWDTMNRLHEKGYIANPVGKAKSVRMTEEGYKKAEELFEKLFVNR